jgi:hypothetical protein
MLHYVGLAYLHSFYFEFDLVDVKILVTLEMIYPGCLSEIGSAFRRLVPKGTHVKDSVEYRNCFLGSEAVVCVLTNRQIGPWFTVAWSRVCETEVMIMMFKV